MVFVRPDHVKLEKQWTSFREFDVGQSRPKVCTRSLRLVICLECGSFEKPS